MFLVVVYNKYLYTIGACCDNDETSKYNLANKKNKTLLKMIKFLSSMLLASINRACVVKLLVLIALLGTFCGTTRIAQAKSGKSTEATQSGQAKKTKKWHEADFVDAHCLGEIEFVLSDRTRVDCLTDTHAIEYDWGKKWAESLGQALFYSAMTGKKAGIVLIVNPRTKDRYLKRLNKAISDNNLDVDVWTIKEQKT